MLRPFSIRFTVLSDFTGRTVRNGHWTRYAETPKEAQDSAQAALEREYPMDNAFISGVYAIEDPNVK